MSLKTLKDIPIVGESTGYGKVGWDRGLREEKKLKQLAIEWVKELQKEENWVYNQTVTTTFKFAPLQKTENYEDDSSGAIAMLIHFFNLTEKDLEER